MTRRGFLYSAATPLVSVVLAQSRSGVASGGPPALSKMGIATTSFAIRRSRDTYELLEYCHSLGASGIQAAINGDLTKIRARAEQLGMYVEAMVSLPRGGDTSVFERSLQDAKTAGATVVRAAALGGRRYETFAALADWKKFVAQSCEALKLAVPILEKQKILLALENHKDWTLEEMLNLLKSYSSEQFGVCLDFGNNIALLDDPMEMVEKLAPYTLATHVKDMAVQPCEDGFLLSEVRLGEGFLDLRRMVALIDQARPKTRFSLEMITRDPLQVPCLTDKYWTVFPDRNGGHLARTLRLVQEQGRRGKPLPRISQFSREDQLRAEEANVKACLQYARAKLSL